MNASKEKIKTKPIFWENKRLQIIAISFFVFFLYSKIISFDYIGLDEPTLIIDNYEFLRTFDIPQAFQQHVFYAKNHYDNPKDYYRPMLIMSFMMDAVFSSKVPDVPKIFHFSNIIYHIISCILLFTLFQKLNTNSKTAFFLTFIFAAHPMLTQAIAWIPGRNDSLIAIFILLSFISFINYLQEPKPKHLILYSIGFLLALFTKESAVVLVGVCFFYMIFIYKIKLKPISYASLVLASTTALLTWYFMRNHALQQENKDFALNNLFGVLLENIPLYLQYIQKIVLPFNLSVMSTVKDTNIIAGIVSLSIIVAGIFLSKKKRPGHILLGITWFVLFLSPSLVTKYFEGLEHRAYLPMVGIFICVAEFGIFNFSVQHKKHLYIMISIILIFVIISFSRLPLFDNRVSYWESAIKTSEYSSLACLNLGKTYETMARYEDAIKAYREGLKRNPDEKLLHNNIGGAYIYMKRYEEAEVEIKKEIELHPDNSFAYYNLGLIRKLEGNSQAAFPLWKKSIEKNENFINAYQQLAEYYRMKNDTLNYRASVKEINRINNFK